MAPAWTPQIPGLGMNPEWLRTLLLGAAQPKNEDIDFNAEDFMLRVNAPI